MEKIQQLLQKYEGEQQRIMKKKKYNSKTADLRYVLGLIHGVKNTLKILNANSVPQPKHEVCQRVNDNNSNRCINCGVKAGHACGLQTS